MNLLIKKDDNELFTCLNFILQKEPTWKIFTFDDYNDGFNVYNNNSIDIIIIDIAQTGQKKFIAGIVKINELQKIINVSSKLTNSEIQGCEYCATNRNRRRILKPVHADALYYTIRDFDNHTCKYFTEFNHIETILEEILERYVFYSYDIKEEMIIPGDNVNMNSVLPEYLEIFGMLEKYDIRFKAEENLRIRILK